MNPRNERKILFRAKKMSKYESKSSICLPKSIYPIDPEFYGIKLVSKPIDNWNPFGPPEKCMICWKPLEIHGKDANAYMECRHCGRKAHQDHMLRWLAKKDFCPYCQGKW